ncbi:MAG: response regulator, partial [Geobacteraceae bacterium]|nr:response regulator [Geobacteraceae bacterium]
VDQQQALTLGTWMMLSGNIVNTSIAILLPACIGSATTDELPVPPSFSGTRKAAADAKLRVLIVEDNDINRQVTELFLDGRYETDHAFTGKEAVEKAQAGLFDIVLMDIHLGK